jgi:stress response protein YsnF
VQKRTRANEEVVVRKQVNQRTEKVRDKVRQTEVDVQQGNAGSRGGRNSIQR